jgi:hypothetical protein
VVAVEEERARVSVPVVVAPAVCPAVAEPALVVLALAVAAGPEHPAKVAVFGKAVEAVREAPVEV